ncbi:MAG TPA: carboxypeptidase regulatory-like domain-containing protein, partial [Planctomycetota bacterium]|nr:carboxypeptidase regulatory-like domain-containing protein [Planctomycetota bacterium]
MASGRTLRAIVGAAAALLLVVAVYLVARPEDGGDASSPSVARAADPAPAPAELPAVPVGSARALDAGGDTSHLAAPGPTSGAVPLAAAPLALADIGQPVTLSGRVVDERGAPIAGAEVIHVASPAVIKALGRKKIPFGPDLPWDDFVRTRSDEQGRFALYTHELPRPEREARPPVQDGAYSPEKEPVPSLVVLHPDYQAALHVCHGYRAGDYDAGEIALQPGCKVVGRLADESGAAVAGGAVRADDLDEPDDARWNQWNVAKEALHTVSGDDGRFQLGSLWPGDMQCTIEAAGFVPLGRKLTLVAGQTVDAGDIVLDRGGAIAGRVLDAQGAPVAGATVKGRSSQVDLTGMLQGALDTTAWEFEMIVKSDDVIDTETVSDATGAFELTALAGEKYTLLAGLAGYEPVKLPEVPVGTRDATLTLVPSAAAVVTVLDAHTHEPVVGVSATGRRLTGEAPRGSIDHSTRLQVLTGQEALTAAATGSDAGV